MHILPRHFLKGNMTHGELLEDSLVEETLN